MPDPVAVRRTFAEREITIRLLIGQIATLQLSLDRLREAQHRGDAAELRPDRVPSALDDAETPTTPGGALDV